MRTIPDGYLSISALIKFNTGSSGSGFFYNNGDTIYFFTAKHVLVNAKNERQGNIAEFLSYSADLADTVSNRFTIDVEKAEKNGDFLLHPTHDVAAIRIGTINDKQSFDIINLDNVNSISPKGLAWVVKEGITSYEDVMISNDVFIFGYPGSIGLTNSPQFNYEKPLLRKGIVASKYEKASTIILDCPVYYGNSGGPVIQYDLNEKRQISYKVIGVVSQFIPYVEQWINNRNSLANTSYLNSGYSVAVTIDKCLELI
jgi:V8-like Glu-specific endopeptidase